MGDVELDPTRPLIVQLPPPPRFSFDPEFLKLSGLERLRTQLAGKRRMGSLFRLTGMRPSDVGVGMCTMSMPASLWWQTGTGIFSAGVLAFVADAGIKPP